MREIVKTQPSMEDAEGIYMNRAPGPHPWRNINTAPTDGTPVLICWEGDVWDPSVAFQEDGRWGSLNSDMSVFWHRMPTHWMPLPEPPQKMQ